MFAPVRIMVPVPALVRLKAPLMTLFTVMPPAPTVHVWVAPRAMLMPWFAVVEPIVTAPVPVVMPPAPLMVRIWLAPLEVFVKDTAEVSVKLMVLAFALVLTLMVSAPATLLGPRMITASAVVGALPVSQLPAVPHRPFVVPFQVTVAALAACRKTPAQKSASKPARVARKRLREGVWRNSFKGLEVIPTNNARFEKSVLSCKRMTRMDGGGGGVCKRHDQISRGDAEARRGGKGLTTEDTEGGG